MIAIVLRKRALSPVRLVLKVTFLRQAPKGIFLLLYATVVFLCTLGSIN